MSEGGRGCDGMSAGRRKEEGQDNREGGRGGGRQCNTLHHLVCLGELREEVMK